jgi:pimeloyl-ACP methyl ester carboxylesterase
MRTVSVIALAFFVALPSFAAHSAHPSRSRLSPCKVPGKDDAQVDALCGTYEVWENREARAGRKIGLRIVVLPARSANPLPDPVLDLAGGPGAADTPVAGSVANLSLRQERDLVFIDQRGTGEPDRLSCRLGGDDLQSRLGDMFPLDAVRRCRDELAKKYDLTLYSVDAAVDDFDEIVHWLGYSKVNLFSGSYGTRTAQIYLRRHPESVRSAILWGVVPMDEPVALSHAAGGQRALDLVLAACEEDAACRAQFRDPRKDFRAVMDRLSQGPVEAEVSDPQTGRTTRARFSREVVAEGIRFVLYSSEASAALPLLFHQAAAGDWKPLAQTVVYAKAGVDEIITRGVFFSVTCSQDFPFIDPAEVPARTAGSFLGDDRVRQHIAVCALWPHTRIDPQEREAIHSDIPVLMISGERDPVTPPAFADRASRFLTRSLHVVEPGASHEDSFPCMIELTNDFIRRGTTEGLDTSSCLSQMKPLPFLFKLPDEGIRPFKVAASARKLELKPCTGIASLPPGSRCGTYEVWENRAVKSGRKIPLRVAVIPALGPDKLSDALTFFGGGPGESNVESAPEVLELFGDLRQRRDILLVDFRGTGGSGGLFCPEMQGGAGAQGLLDSYYPPDKVKACAEQLAKAADLNQYNNDNSVDDIEEVRAALGYSKLNIYGGSGGSRTALVYLRRHPESVRTATVGGVAPPDERGPIGMARHAQQALDGLIAECESDAACHGAFPKFRDEVAAVLRQTEKEPVTVALIDGETGRPMEVRLTRSGVAQTLRYVLYRPLAVTVLPLMIHLAAQGDWKLLGETAAHFASGRDFGSLADGYYLSLTCAEDVPYIREDEIAPAVQGTFLGDFRIRKQQEACAAWPVKPVDRKFLDPVVSDVPVLLISGERDPVTPLVSAERAARTLKNSLSVVVPDGSHGYFGLEGGLECFDNLVNRFIEAGTVQGLDTSCLARTKRPEFALRWDPEVELPADQLARLAGTYKGQTSGLEIRIEAAGQRLKMLEGDYPPTILMATSPTRFRVEGMGNGTFIDFQITDGRATGLTVPWSPGEAWVRTGA